MLEREAVARREVGQTTVSPRLARALAGWFLLMLALLPLVEIIGRVRAPHGAADAWSQLGRIPETGGGGLFAANRAVLEVFGAFETALEDQSTVGRTLRPPTQSLLSGWLGAGNERVYVGRDGWLFYRPDVEYVTGRGFLDEREQTRRIAAAAEYEVAPQPDPRPAITSFARDLAARGITLVLLPTPVKPSIHAAELWASGGDGRYINPSEDVLFRQLRQEGILVFDPADVIASAAAPQYLATDTHWRPGTMQRVAEALAAFVLQHVALPSGPPAGYAAQPREAAQLGDSAAMLDLPPAQALYPREHVALRFIVDAAGDPWRASREAGILLLGDSFTNMYSLETMGWGESAGLAEQLSFVLQRPIDRIVQNDQGAHATRALLAREVGGAHDRLAGKRVVIWQFAARELAFGDWQAIALP